MNSDLMWSDCDVALAGFSDNSGLETSILKRSKWKYHMYKFIYYCGNINISLSLVSLLFSSYSLIYLKKYLLPPGIFLDRFFLGWFGKVVKGFSCTGGGGRRDTYAKTLNNRPVGR